MIDRVFGGRYRVTEKIGIGGMAEVYKASDEVLGRTVAIKVMLPHFASDPTFAARFKQEAQAAANLQSPYIVNIYDWGHDEVDGTYYIVMELVRGTDLKTAIEQRGAINQRKVAEIGSQVSAALNVAHGYDVIHRDIKPQNIMIQPDGNAKVMDFGIAHANNANLTQTGSVLGTAYYVSPEQAQGKPLSATSDIYSLGVVLYEAATGRVPFDGPDAVSIAVKQVNEQPVPPRAIDNNIDPALEAIILKALKKQPSERFATAEQMRQALNDYLAGKPAVGGVDSDARTRVINRPAVVTAAEGTAVMPALATAATVTKTSSANNTAQNSNSKRTALIVALVSVLVVALAGVAIYFAFCSSPAETQVTVPKVVGLVQDDAKTKLEEANLKLGEIKEDSSETVEAGKIISQDPAAASKVNKDTAVNLVISTGSGNVEVPDLRNMTPAEAEDALSKLKLSYGLGSTKVDPDVENGKVCGQSPAAKTKVAVGTKITYDVSAGPDTASIPNVYGMSKDAAAAAITASGFKVAYADDEFSGTVAEGSVISQDKSGEATKGDTVTLTLSKGAKPEPTPQVKVPNIIGMDVNAASNALAAVGLTISYDGDATGKTVSQTKPAAGTSVDKGSEVSVEFGSVPKA